MDHADEIQQHSIGLWGPASSGKTWLMSALVRRLSQIKDPHFTYRLTHAHGDPHVNDIAVRPTPPIAAQSTEDLNDTMWRFQRLPRDAAANSVIRYTHTINLHDDKGLRTTQDDYYRATLINLATSDALLLMLDHTLLPNSPFKQTSLSSTSGSTASLTPEAYLERIDRLFASLSEERQETPGPRYFAVCITKIDLLKVQKRDPWNLLRLFFSDEIHDFFQERSRQPGVALETFSISSVGYLDDAQTEPNYDPLSAGLKSPERWKPVNVEAPFFWLFDQVERSRIESGPSSLLGRLLLHGARRQAYIPYPIPRR